MPDTDKQPVNACLVLRDKPRQCLGTIPSTYRRFVTLGDGWVELAKPQRLGDLSALIWFCILIQEENIVDGRVTVALCEHGHGQQNVSPDRERFTIANGTDPAAHGAVRCDKCGKMAWCYDFTVNDGDTNDG